MPAYRVIAQPSQEPVSIDEAKLWIKQDVSDDDVLIAGLITAARDLCETYTDRALVTQTWLMVMDAFPGYIDRRSGAASSVRTLATGGWFLLGSRWGFSLPVAPVQSVTSLTYQDQYGNTQTLRPNVDYTVDLISSPGRIFPVFSTFWPLTQYAPNAVQVQFVCGYGVPSFGADSITWTGQPVPEAIRTAIKMIVSWMYNNRDSEVVTTGVIRDNPVVSALLSQYRDARY